MDQFLPQLRHLQKCPPGPIEPGTAAELWKKVPVVTFYKGIPGIFRIYPNQLAADGRSNDFRIGHFSVSTFLLCETEIGTNFWYRSSIIV